MCVCSGEWFWSDVGGGVGGWLWVGGVCGWVGVGGGGWRGEGGSKVYSIKVWQARWECHSGVLAPSPSHLSVLQLAL